MPAADSTQQRPKPPPAHTTPNPCSAHVHPYAGTGAGRGQCRKEAGWNCFNFSINRRYTQIDGCR